MNLLIIDDEPLTVQTLKNNMPWKELGIDEVYTAFEPRFARQLVTSLPIHIILCDIEMPGETGIEFLKWMKSSTDCDAITILLTCHDEFNYAKEGISLGVMEYILKPIAFADLGDIIRKAVERYKEQTLRKSHVRDAKLWHESRSALTRGFWQDFFNSNTAKETLMEKSALGYTDDMRFLLIVLKINGETNSLSGRDITVFLEKQCGDLFGPSGLEFTLFSPDRSSIYIIAHPAPATKETPNLPEIDIKSIYSQIKDLVISLQINQVRLSGCMQNFCSMQELPALEESFLYFLDHMEETSGFYLLDATDTLAHAIDQAAYDKVFQEISDYVKRHLSDDITRQDVADAVHLNADYLSKVFKRRAGITLSEYIRAEKLNHSKYLLTNSDMSINDISMLLNFSSQSHFSSTFKKQYGISPADYRSRR